MMHEITIKAINGYEMNLSGGACADFTGPGEACWQFPEMIGTGIFKQIELRPGFYLFITDYQVKQHCVWNITCNRPGFGFGFCVSGQMQSRAMGMDRSVTICRGQCPLLYFPCQSGTGADANTFRALSDQLWMGPRNTAITSPVTLHRKFSPPSNQS
jgi:hypothetical protein